ncbi:hypothetical protein A6V39_04380 [Candidatus Mycoplasma haematobovis]|uniref:Uncharacterized protein n=1 Tax=Candidatus Mycoplasma haematobovis TaxID=432608 RepID=A0A1A9QC29_9MOLU|nr:hypothetical protein [Candidatus Mycoplasma haematobovis]OAL10122.1 hypothetical protein A6V39_04380 [Candidatus Mycoplasma haematobovis]
MHNALELNTLKNLDQNKYRFHPSLTKYLNKKDIFEKQKFSLWKANNGKIKAAISSEAYCLSCATLSDRELIYGDTYFSEKVRELKEEELVQDILWSLWEESKYNDTLIHTESIKVDLQLNKDNKITEVKQFSISFKVSNLSGRKAQVFRSIDLDPHTQTEVNILLNNAELKVAPVAAGIHGLKYSSWNLFPKNDQWKVVKNIQQPNKQTITSTHFSLQLIYGSSRFIPHSISRDEKLYSMWMKTAFNTIDYGYIKDKLTPYLTRITEQQVKEDIESWYGGYVAYLIRTRIEDIQNLIDLMQKKTIENDKGIKESIFEQVLNNYQFRNNLYHHFRLNDTYKQVLNKLLTNDKNSTGGIRITIEEVIGLLKSWIYQLKQIQDSIRVEIKWIETPRRVYSQAGQSGDFPNFAFSFEQKIIWTKEMKIPLKGVWNISENKYEELKQQQTESGKYKFDLTNKLINLKEVLTPLTGLISGINGGKFGDIDIMNSLIPDVGKFIGLESLKINKDEAITYTYKTNGTPLTLALDETSDLQGKLFPRMSIGWKALDVSAGLDLSKFTQLFYSIYEKFDLGSEKDNPLSYNDLFQLEAKLNQSPITFIAHAINSIFDENYKKSHRKDTDINTRPWPVFFNSLLGNALVFEHSQMVTGYSKLFFDYPKWWGTENKTENKASKNCKASTSSEYWGTNFSFDNREAIAKPKNDEIENIARSLIFNHSMYLPDAPIVLEGSIQKGQYDQFLNGAGKTSQGIVNGTKDIIQAIKQEYDTSSNLFEGRKVIDWNKAKVSFAQLNLKKAIESVLSQKNTWSDLLTGTLLSSVGIYFHKILGEALIRDGFWININMMHEYGMFTKKDMQITKRMDYFPNSELWLKVNPELDPAKLQLGWLVDKFVKK